MYRAILPISIVVAGAIGAAPASAASMEVTDEAEHCSQMESTQHVVDGGCEIHASSDEDLLLREHFAGVGEVLVAICTSELEARIQEDGAGFAYNHHMEGQSCGFTSCAEAGGGPQLASPFNLVEAAGTETLSITLCFARMGLSIPCSIAMLVVTDDTHDYEVRAGGQRCSALPTASLNAHWNVEGTPIAITH